MAFLFVGSTGDHAGHTVLTWALAKRLVEKGFKVGFFKPFGTHQRLHEGNWVDTDALLLKTALKLKEPVQYICPYPLADKTPWPKGLEGITGRIRTLAEELSVGRDILIVMGSRHIFFDDASFGISDIFLNTELEADFVLVERFRSAAKSMYSILSTYSLLPGRIKGVILNRVSLEEMDSIKTQLVAPLSKKGVVITAVIPEDPALSWQSVGEISQIIKGEFLCGEEYQNQAVTGTTLSISGLKKELVIFKRVFNKIILLKPGDTGGEENESRVRPSVAGILLTGGRTPPLQIIEMAKSAGIPLVLVKEDTFMAMQKLEEEASPLSARDEGKVRHFTKLMDRDGGLENLIGSLSFSK